MECQPFAISAKLFGQLLDKVGVLGAKIRRDTPIVQIDAGIHFTHYQVYNGLDVCFAAFRCDQHVIHQVTAHHTIIGPVSQSRQYTERLLSLGIRQAGQAALYVILSAQIVPQGVQFRQSLAA